MEVLQSMYSCESFCPERASSRKFSVSSSSSSCCDAKKASAFSFSARQRESCSENSRFLAPARSRAVRTSSMRSLAAVFCAERLPALARTSAKFSTEESSLARFSSEIFS